MTTVAQTSGGGSGAAAGWIGSLAHTPFAQVLRRIALEERSGDLQVTGPDAVKTVYFDRGFVVFASSDLKNDRLGESMIEAGRISRREFAVASMLMQDGRRKFGQALVHAGIVSEEELGRWVGAQVNRIVLSLFSAKKGMYSFDERPSNIPVELMVSLSIYRILLEGIRRMSSKRLILSGLGDLDARVRLVDEPPFTLDLRKLGPIDRAVIRASQTPTTFRSIVRRVGADDGAVLRACYSLHCGGLLATDAALARPTRIQEETGTFVLSEIRRKIEDNYQKRFGPDSRLSPTAPLQDVQDERDEPAEIREPPPEESAGDAGVSFDESSPPAEAELELELTPVSSVSDVAFDDPVGSQSPSPPESPIELIEEVLGEMRDEPIVELVEDALPSPQPIARAAVEQEPEPEPPPAEAPAEEKIPVASFDLGTSVVGPDESAAAYVFEPLLRLLRYVKELVSSLLGRLFGKAPADGKDAVDGPIRRPPIDKPPRSRAAVSKGTPAHAPAALAETTKEEVGIPSWSMAGDPAGSASANVEAADTPPSVGTPEWSLRDDSEGKEPTHLSADLGVPSWSMHDDPGETRSPLPVESPEAPVPEPASHFEPPSWSLVADDSLEEAGTKEPLARAEPVRPVPLAPIEEEPPLLELDPGEEEPSPELPVTENQPAPSKTAGVDRAMDMDLVVDLDLEALEGLSIMEQLPVEEIDLAAPTDEVEIELPEEMFFEPEPEPDEPVPSPATEAPEPVSPAASRRPGPRQDREAPQFQQVDALPTVQDESPFVFSEQPLSLEDATASVEEKPPLSVQEKPLPKEGASISPPVPARSEESPLPPARAMAPTPARAGLGESGARKSEPAEPGPAQQPPKPVPGHVSRTPLSQQAPPSKPTSPVVDSTEAASAVDTDGPDSELGEHRQRIQRMKQSGGEARILRDVKLHFKMRDWEGAVPLLEQLVSISPGKALYRGMLARAMSHHPMMRKNAEEHYVEALRLAPQDAELHYWLGLYYKSFGLRSRATHEFRTTLRISPNHQGARKQLGGGKKEDAMGSVFKKLFG